MIIKNSKNMLKKMLGVMGILAGVVVGMPAWAQYYYGPSIFTPVVYSPTRGPVLAQLKQLECTQLAVLLAGAPKDLRDRVNKGESLTIIAPTDEAFKALGKEQIEELMKPENQDKLGQFLSYHLVAGQINEADIKAGEIKTLSGESVRLQPEVAAKQFKINDAKLAAEPRVIKNIRNNDVVVVVIDKVLLPNKR